MVLKSNTNNNCPANKRIEPVIAVKGTTHVRTFKDANIIEITTRIIPTEVIKSRNLNVNIVFMHPQVSMILASKIPIL